MSTGCKLQTNVPALVVTSALSPFQRLGPARARSSSRLSMERHRIIHRWVRFFHYRLSQWDAWLISVPRLRLWVFQVPSNMQRPQKNMRDEFIASGFNCVRTNKAHLRRKKPKTVVNVQPQQTKTEIYVLETGPYRPYRLQRRKKSEGRTTTPCVALSNKPFRSKAVFGSTRVCARTEFVIH